MIITLDWITFQQNFMKTSEFVYVYETELGWTLYTCNNTVKLKTVVFKQEESVSNIAFVDRHLMGTNIIKVMNIQEKISVHLGVINSDGY